MAGNKDAARHGAGTVHRRRGREMPGGWPAGRRPPTSARLAGALRIHQACWGAPLATGARTARWRCPQVQRERGAVPIVGRARVGGGRGRTGAHPPIAARDCGVSLATGCRRRGRPHGRGWPPVGRTIRARSTRAAQRLAVKGTGWKGRASYRLPIARTGRTGGAPPWTACVGKYRAGHRGVWRGGPGGCYGRAAFAPAAARYARCALCPLRRWRACGQPLRVPPPVSFSLSFRAPTRRSSLYIPISHPHSSHTYAHAAHSSPPLSLLVHPPTRLYPPPATPYPSPPLPLPR